MPKEDTIGGQLDLWFEALKSGHVERVMQLYSPNAVLLSTLENEVKNTPEKIAAYFKNTFLPIHPHGSLVGNKNILVSGDMAADSGLYDFEIDCPIPPDRDIQLTGDMVIGPETYKFATSFKAKPKNPCPNPRVVAHARYTFVYKWDGSKWLIAQHHSSKLPEAKTVKELRWLRSEFID